MSAKLLGVVLLTFALVIGSTGVSHAPPFVPSFCGEDNWPHPTICAAYHDARDDIFELLGNLEEFIAERCADTPGGCDPVATVQWIRSEVETFCDGDSPHPQVCTAYRNLVGQANECAAELGDPEVCAGADLNIPCWFWWPWRTPNATCTPTVAPQEGEDFECVVNAPPPEFDVTAEQVNGEGLLECEDKSGVIIAGHLDVTIQSHRFGPIWNNRQHCVASGGPGSFSAFAACRAPCDFVTEGTSQWRVIADAVVDLTVGVWKDQDIGGPENFECDPPTE